MQRAVAAMSLCSKTGIATRRHMWPYVYFCLYMALFLLLQVALLLPCETATPYSQDTGEDEELLAVSQRETKENWGKWTAKMPQYISGLDTTRQRPMQQTTSRLREGQRPSRLKEQWSTGNTRGERRNAANSRFQDLDHSNSVPAELAADGAAPLKRPFDLLRKAAALFGDSPWILTGDPNADKGVPAITYKQGHAVALAVGAAFDILVPNSQLPQLEGTHESLRLIGTWAANSVELLLADFGAGAYGMTVVPMHPDMTTRRFLEVMLHTQMTHLCTDAQHLELVLDLFEKGQLSNLLAVICLDAVTDHAVLRVQKLELALIDFWDLTDIIKGPEMQKHRSSNRLGFDLAEIHTLLYPRGGTSFCSLFIPALSVPFNGAMLTNENVLASLETLTDWRVGAASIVEGDRILCLDSLTSIHQRVLHLAVIQAGATVAFAQRGWLALREDVRAMYPTIIAATGGILPLLHAAARRALKRMGRLSRFVLLLKLRWRARSFWRTGDLDLIGRPPFEQLKQLLGRVHTLIVAPALAPSELLKELQLLYSACCSPQTGAAFSSRQQNANPADPRGFQRIRAAPLGWASPVVTVALEELSAWDAAGIVEFHADGVPGRGAKPSRLVLDGAREESDRRQLTSGSTGFEGFHRSILNNRRGHTVTAGEVVIQGACVSVGYYRHQTAFQRQLTQHGMYKTGLVAISAGADFPLLMISALARNVLTAEGEFIDLEEAERQIRKSPLVAIIQPRRGAVLRWAKTRFAIEEYTWLTLESFERPKAIYLVPHDVELPVGGLDSELDQKQSGHTTVRRQLAEAYAKPIREMYASLVE